MVNYKVGELNRILVVTFITVDPTNGGLGNAIFSYSIEESGTDIQTDNMQSKIISSAQYQVCGVDFSKGDVIKQVEEYLIGTLGITV